MTELEHMVEHQRYLRLQHLLERSTIYSKFLLKQMDEQKDKEKKEREKTGRQKKVNKSNEEEKVIDIMQQFDRELPELIQVVHPSSFR